jgi:hypothetical protein
MRQGVWQELCCPFRADKLVYQIMNTQKIIHWLPRVLAILFIIFISLFALDVFEMEAGFWQKIGGFLIHLIPSYILIIATIIAWKKEFIGGVLFIIFSVALAIWTRVELASLLVILPPFIIGILFLVAGRKK